MGAGLAACRALPVVGAGLQPAHSAGCRPAATGFSRLQTCGHGIQQVANLRPREEGRAVVLPWGRACSLPVPHVANPRLDWHGLTPGERGFQRVLELEKGTGTSLCSEPVPFSIEAPRREPGGTAGRWAIPLSIPGPRSSPTSPKRSPNQTPRKLEPPAGGPLGSLRVPEARKIPHHPEPGAAQPTRSGLAPNS